MYAAVRFRFVMFAQSFSVSFLLLLFIFILFVVDQSAIVCVAVTRCTMLLMISPFLYNTIHCCSGGCCCCCFCYFGNVGWGIAFCIFVIQYCCTFLMLLKIFWLKLSIELEMNYTCSHEYEYMDEWLVAAAAAAAVVSFFFDWITNEMTQSNTNILR